MPVVTQPVLSAFVMAAALGLLRVRRAGRLRSGGPLEKTAHRLLCEWRRCRHVLRQTINLLLEKDSKFSIVSIEYRVIWINILLIYNRPTVLGIPTTRVLWNQFREKAPDLCINYLFIWYLIDHLWRTQIECHFYLRSEFWLRFWGWIDLDEIFRLAP